MEIEADFYEIPENQKVICQLCPAYCTLTEGKHGICQNRFNKNGKLYTNNFGEVVTLAIDPIEKKPLYHFLPSQQILSTGANGCNFGCLNCQNWEISQQDVKTKYISPESLVQINKEKNCIGVAFTYTEPFIWFEYIFETVKLLKEENLAVVLVSNGYVNEKPLEKLLPYIDAINIDLKSIETDFYKKICKAKLQPVLHTIKTVAQSDTHLELTYLIIPELNDTDAQIHKWVDFVAEQSEYIPIHFSAYFPDYKMENPATSKATLYNAVEIARKTMKFVYVGNVKGSSFADTHCPACTNLVIHRDGYITDIVGLHGSHCTNCGFNLKIVQSL